MTGLVIKLNSEVAESNFGPWKEILLKEIEAARGNALESDDDFGTAENDVKSLKTREQELQTAKAEALKQAEAVSKLFDDIDGVSEEARQARLDLSKKITARKDSIREDLISDGEQSVISAIQAGSEEIKASPFIRSELYPKIKVRLTSATKNKRTIDSLKKSIDTEVEVILDEIKATQEAIDTNKTTLENVPEKYRTLFAGDASLIYMPSGELSTLIMKRMTAAEEEKRKEAEAAKLRAEEEQAAQLKAEEERLQREEDTRLEAERQKERDEAPPPEPVVKADPPAPVQVAESAPVEPVASPTTSHILIKIDPESSPDEVLELVDELWERFGSRGIVENIDQYCPS